MATTFSRLEIINAALLAQGQTELAAEGDGSLEWRTLAAQWPMVVEAELQDGYIHTSLVEIELPTRAGDGDFGFDDAYTAPTTALHIRRVFTEDENGDRCYLDGWVHGQVNVHVDEPDGIWVEAVEAIDPEAFSPLFIMGITAKMEAIILRSMKEEYQAAQSRDQWAEEKLQRARTASSNSKGPVRFFRDTSRFSDARFRRG